MKVSQFIRPLFFCSVFAIVGCATTPTTKSVHNENENVAVEQATVSKTDYTGPKLRIGVVNFKNDTPRKVRDIEKVATSILTTMLHETGNFIVIPQQDMESILGQQALGASGAIDSNTAAQMGKVLGLNAILTGSITSYTELVEGSTSLFTQSKTQVAKVGVDYRIVDTTTGVQLFASSGKGEFRKTSGGVLGFGSKSSKDASLKDGALRDVKGANIYINAGKQTGIKVGDILVAQKLGEQILDPETGVSLGRAPGKILGKVKITGHFGKNGSVASTMSGGGFSKNDMVVMGN
jgi:curli biogenesis system outer membrane secretion channel CsgG